MTRRKVGQVLAAAMAAGAISADDSHQLSPPPGYSVVDMNGLKHYMPLKPEQIAMLIYPGMTALDLIGPQQAFGYMMGSNLSLLWKTLDPITTDTNVKISPTAAFRDITGPVDVLFVPGGGKGTVALMTDPEVMAFLREKGATAQYVTSVCSGSLVLGAAGLLRGYKATSHWAVRNILSELGAIPTIGRVVQDRNRITAGGVTAGIDFGLHLVAQLRGTAYAEALQLILEYDPQPPFHAGSPADAPTYIRDFAIRMYAPLLKSAQFSAESARSTWSKS